MKKLNVTIRPAKQADLKTVYRLSRIPELAAPNRQAAERWWIKDFLKSRRPFFVAVIDGRVVGFVLGEYATGKVAIQHLLAVHPDYRRHGVGLQLLHAFEREVRRRGMACILLYLSGGKRWANVLGHHRYAAGSLVREYQKFL